jgi:cytochrome c oxidase subunit 2
LIVAPFAFSADVARSAMVALNVSGVRLQEYSPVGKPWAVFFAVNMAAMAALCFAAPALGWWMPEGVSTHAESVDFLFNVILAITAFFFFLTEAILIVFLWKYGSGEKAATGFPKVLAPLAGHLTPHKIEMAWTVVPAAILLYIAFAQVNTWAHVKYRSRFSEYVGDKTETQVELSSRQFEWRFRYPSADRATVWLAKSKTDDDVKRDKDSFAKTIQSDDIHTVNELHVIKDNPVLIHLSTRDVLHSFNLPHFRVKQDALPGKVIPVWFTPTKSNVVRTKDAAGRDVWFDGNGRDEQGHPIDKSVVWDIPCAELCGWGHWRMVGRVYVHPTKEDFLDWLEQTGKSEHGKTAVK